jgi:hypothetical protein
MMEQQIEQMVMDLRKEGYDCFQIARKLELTILEVENIIYKSLEIDPEQIMAWMGAHH